MCSSLNVMQSALHRAQLIGPPISGFPARTSRFVARPARSFISRQLRTSNEQSALTHQNPEELVSSILHDIEGTDGKRDQVDASIRKLEATGAEQEPRPLENPLIWGNYDVAYVSAGRAEQSGAPAGGRFRGTLGRAIFQTTCVCQSILEPDLVINKVGFRLLGLLGGSIGLRGRLEAVPDGGKDDVKVKFDPPQLSFAGGIHLRIGPSSSVQLKTTYLDERIRCGLGSRGSLFVFRRGGQSEREEMDQVGLKKMHGSVKLLIASAIPWLALGCLVLWRSHGTPGRIACVALAALQLGIATVVWRGGMIDESVQKQQVQGTS